MSNTSSRWRTVDIVVASVIAAAFGVVFWAWNLLYTATDAAFAFFPPAHAVLYGVWLLPGVLAGLVIRKPGAALYAETLASIISALLGSAWGTTVIPQGLLQGLGAELAFLAVGYRSFRLPVAVLSGLLAGLAAGVWDTFAYFAANDLWAFRIPMIVITVLSAGVIAGAGGWALTRALAATGVLDRFPSGRDRDPV